MEYIYSIIVDGGFDYELFVDGIVILINGEEIGFVNIIVGTIQSNYGLPIKFVAKLSAALANL